MGLSYCTGPLFTRNGMLCEYKGLLPVTRQVQPNSCYLRPRRDGAMHAAQYARLAQWRMHTRPGFSCASIGLHNTNITLRLRGHLSRRAAQCGASELASAAAVAADQDQFGIFFVG